MFDGIASKPRLIWVRVDDIGSVPDDVRPAIDLMARGSRGRYAASHILALIAAADMQLWTIRTDTDLLCTIVTELHQYPTGLRCLRTIGLVGRRPLSWKALDAEMERTARDVLRCDRMESLHLPRFIALLPGYRTTHWLSEKVIA